MKVRPISITRPLPGAVPGLPEDASPDALIVYIARVSNPANQENHATGGKLIKYCIRKGHWSPFEMVDVTMEIETSRAIAAQILRHRSFSFQEFSQRYSPVTHLVDLVEPVEIRAKHTEGNRQGSGENMGDSKVKWYHRAPGFDGTVTVDYVVADAMKTAERAYEALLDAGAAPECARMVLPLATRTRLYMKGSVRSWIHYLGLRCAQDTQKEHRLVAQAVRSEFDKLFPSINEALG